VRASALVVWNSHSESLTSGSPPMVAVKTASRIRNTESASSLSSGLSI